MNGVLAYLHPLSGAAVLLLLVYVASLGVRARTQPRARAALLARHARLAPVVYWLALASWAGGALSSAWLRDDLDFAASFHFRIGTALIAALSGSTLTARSMDRGSAAARELHPWLGAAAVLLAAAHAVTGLRITP